MNGKKFLIFCLVIALSLSGCTKGDKKQNSKLPSQIEKLEEKQPAASSPQEKKEFKEMYASVNGLNIRSGPGTSHSIIKKVNLNERLKVSLVETKKEWVKVLFDGQEGWVNYKFLSPKLIQTPAPVQVKDEIVAWGFKRKNDHTQPSFGKAGELANRYNAIFVGNPQSKVVYLTFDEGYENGYTSQILDILQAKGVPAAFFVTGPYIKQNPDLVKRMLEEGHIVGNHTVHHPSLPTLSDQEILNEFFGVEQLALDKTGYSISKFVRPPRGEFSERMLKVLQREGYIAVFWSMAYSDWETDKQQGAERAVNHVCENIHPGAVILLHAVSKDNADGLEQIIDEVRLQGYEFKSLREFR